MRSWVRNLADWFPFIPDGCVIWAWQNIRQGENYDEASKYLLEAGHRGLPLHTEGLRLLSEGLRGMGESGTDSLTKLTKAAGSVVWNSPFTARFEGTLQQEDTPTTWDIGYMPVA